METADDERVRELLELREEKETQLRRVEFLYERQRLDEDVRHLRCFKYFDSWLSCASMRNSFSSYYQDGGLPHCDEERKMMWDCLAVRKIVNEELAQERLDQLIDKRREEYRSGHVFRFRTSPPEALLYEPEEEELVYFQSIAGQEEEERAANGAAKTNGVMQRMWAALGRSGTAKESAVETTAKEDTIAAAPGVEKGTGASEEVATANE